MTTYIRDMANNHFLVQPGGQKNWTPIGDPEMTAWLNDGGQLGWVETIEERTQIMEFRIGCKRDAEARAEFEMNGMWFQAKDSNRLEVLGLCALVWFGYPLPANKPWRCLSGERPIITEQLLRELIIAHANHVGFCYEVSDYHLEQMRQAPEPAFYDFSTNWPPKYTGHRPASLT